MGELVHYDQPQSITRANTDAQLITMFLANKGSDNTRKTYTKALEQFFQFVGCDLSQITVDDVIAYKQHLESLYTSDHTVKLKLNAVKSLLTFAQEVGYIRFNVAKVVKAPKAETVIEDKVLSEAQVFDLLAKTTNQRDNLLIRLMYASGGRVSDISGLIWGDVKDGYIIFRHRKGDKVGRVALSDDTMGRLRSFKPIGATDDQAVFQTKYQGQVKAMGRNTIYRQIRRIGERCGIQGLHPHMFRHSHATHALQRGASIHVVKETLGHSNIATTNTYLHTLEGESSAKHLAV